MYIRTHACKLSMVRGKMEGARVGQEWCGVGGWVAHSGFAYYIWMVR